MHAISRFLNFLKCEISNEAVNESLWSIFNDVIDDDDEDKKVDKLDRKRFHNIPPPPFDLEPEPNPKVKKEEYTIYTTLTVKSMTKGHKIDGIDKKKSNPMSIEMIWTGIANRWMSVDWIKDKNIV